MALRVKISSRAAGQVRRAAEWWTANRPAAPGAIAADLSAALAILAEQPEIGAKCKATKTRTVRRLFLSRVRYVIYYTVENDELHVLAFWHASRGHEPSL